MRIGLLTGGGDCPGLNAVIRGVVHRGSSRGHTFVGFKDGWAGVLNRVTTELTVENTADILAIGGTILGTSRTNPFKGGADGAPPVIASLQAEGIDALVPIGGEDTLGVANKLSQAGVKLVGVPKTIDNDLGATDVTFGFQTAVEIATEAIDRLHTTAASHHRVIVCEVMGRHAGWIATHAGIAGNADVILIPEEPFDIEAICEALSKRREAGRGYAIVVAAEGALPEEGTLDLEHGGATDAFGHARLMGIGAILEHEIEQRTGFETRATVLGHIQRGGSPTAYDRVLATRFGVEAMDAVDAGDFGKIVALRGTEIARLPLAEAVSELKLVDPALFAVANVFTA
jgi:6-phosphofructokinase 1